MRDEGVVRCTLPRPSAATLYNGHERGHQGDCRPKSLLSRTFGEPPPSASHRLRTAFWKWWPVEDSNFRLPDESPH
jgi:hypothetical protein